MNRRKMSKKMIRTIIIALLVFVILVGVCIYTVFIRPNLEQDTVVYMETQVQRGDLVQGIMENGSITLGESTISYDLEINYEEDEEDEDDDEDEEESSRYLEIEEVYVAQGQRIKAGDPLFRFSQDSMDSVRRKLENARSEAQVELAEANTEYDSQIQSAKNTYSTSKASADTASRSYNAAVNKLQSEITLLYGDIQVLEAEIDDLNLKLTDEDTLEEYSDLKYALELAEKKINETGTSSVAAYTDNYAEYQSAKQAFEQIDSKLEGYREQIEKNQEEILDKVEQIAEAQASLGQDQEEAKQSYDSAVLSGNLASEIYDYTASSLQESVDEAAQAVEEAQSLLDEYDAFIGEEGIIYAVQDGLVTSVMYEEGDQLLTTGTMLSYVTEDSFTISIDVSEEDISSINVGDTVDISVNAYPDETYSGIVSGVTTSTASGFSSSTVNFPVTISVQGDTSKLYGGMTADITFVSESVEDVLYVSAKAVTEDEQGNTVVYIKNSSGEMETKSVVTGFSNGSEVEITEGLEEGETVYIASILKAGQDLESLKNAGSAENAELPMEENGEMPEGFNEGDFEMPDGSSGSGFPGGGEMPGGGSRPDGGMPGGRP